MSYTRFDGGSAERREALNAYYDDNVVGAYDFMLDTGAMESGAFADFFATIEGEARTRQMGTRTHLSDRLEYEWVPSEVPHYSAVGHVISEAAKRVTQRLGWDEHEAVLTTIITHQSDDMWSRSKAAFCVDKTPYDKLCLPASAVLDPQSLHQVTSHEFAHVVVLNTAEKRAPHWLDEGIACTMEGRSPMRARARLREAGIWKSPDQLERAFFADRQDPSMVHSIGAAYDQGTVLVGYLQSLRGDAGLVELLQHLGKQPLLAEFISRALNKDQTDHPLHKVFGFGESELFKLAEAWDPHADPINAK